MKIAIIGAGPAGIYTALFLKDFSGSLTLFEKNPQIGVKLKLTGGGRMNLANRNFSEKCYFSNSPNLLKNIFKNPASQQILKLFEIIGTEYKWEEDRAILVSENAELEVKRLTALLNQQKNLKLKLNQTITHIKKQHQQFQINGEIFDYIILTCGSQINFGKATQPYLLATELNHTLTQITPALCPLKLPHNPFTSLAGISLDITLSQPKTQSITNKLLFTHQGLSGPVILDFTVNDLAEKLEINFLPKLSETDFTQQLEIKRKGKNYLKTWLNELLPKRFVLWLMEQIQLPTEKIIADLNKTEVQILKTNLYHFILKNPEKTDFNSSWTIRGGIPLTEINPANLESKIHPQLYFGGEILDVTGLCGGYNLSFAILSAKIISDAILNEKY